MALIRATWRNIQEDAILQQKETLNMLFNKSAISTSLHFTSLYFISLHFTLFYFFNDFHPTIT
jgi:hypothetical protein